jgi:16S rRNA (cytidine1402-2'-O)-methyltransferase
MLYLVPTPIGNLGDISFRALEIFKSSELFLCEDTRVTKTLLTLLSDKYNFSYSCSDFRSFHSHNEQEFLHRLSPDELRNKKVVYVSDAGMPCVSDPGSTLVQFCIDNSIDYDVLPGANAVLTAFAMSGFSTTEFRFFGFLPHKGKERKLKLDRVLGSSTISILYESPHRLLKLFEELSQMAPDREVFVAKELTKMHQSSKKLTAKELYKYLKSITIKGEWVVVIDSVETIGEAITKDDIISLDIPPKQKSKLLAKLTGANVKEIYKNMYEDLQ